MKVVMRYRKKIMVSLRFMFPIEILEMIRDMACKLDIPPYMSVSHLVFYVFILKRYSLDDTYVIQRDSFTLDRALFHP